MCSESGAGKSGCGAAFPTGPTSFYILMAIGVRPGAPAIWTRGETARPALSQYCSLMKCLRGADDRFASSVGPESGRPQKAMVRPTQSEQHWDKAGHQAAPLVRSAPLCRGDEKPERRPKGLLHVKTRLAGLRHVRPSSVSGGAD